MSGKVASLLDAKDKRDMVNALLVKAFMHRSASTFLTLRTVSVSFNSEIEAQEFMRLLVSVKRSGTA